MPFLLSKRRPPTDEPTPSIGHNSWPPPHPGGCCILTGDGWKQLEPKYNGPACYPYENARQPTRVAPLKAEGRFVEMQDPAHYDDQGRYLLDPKEWRPGELERFKQLLDDSRTNSYRSGPSVDYFGNRRMPGRYDKWGVRTQS